MLCMVVMYCVVFYSAVFLCDVLVCFVLFWVVTCIAMLCPGVTPGVLSSIHTVLHTTQAGPANWSGMPSTHTPHHGIPVCRLSAYLPYHHCIPGTTYQYILRLQLCKLGRRRFLYQKEILRKILLPDFQISIPTLPVSGWMADRSHFLLEILSVAIRLLT